MVAARRELRMAGIVAWAVGMAGLAAYLAPHSDRKLLAAAGVAGLAIAASGALVLERWPWTLPFAALACVPARIPLDIGNDEANLLVPLYVVVAALALALGWELLRGDRRSRELGVVALPLAALVAWTGVTILWTDDLREASIFLAAFVLPFGLLAVGVARLPWREKALGWLWAALLASAAAYAGIGLYQWLTRDVFWNPKVIVGNAYAPFYRVNSVFWDPSIYGRYLAIAIVAALAIALFTLRMRDLAVLVAFIALTWLGLLVSFSQSSFLALITGVLAAAALVWRWKAAAALGLVAAVLLTVGFSTPRVRNTMLKESRAGLNNATSGRASLVNQGIRIALHHPVAGVGVGSFKVAYAERTGLRGREPKKAASHSTPVTVAAETGLPGLILLCWLLGAALVAALSGLRRDLPSRAALVAGLTLGAIAVHSFFYNAFFEDPMMWALLGVVAVTAARRAEA
jgi:O-antigen ligase